MKIALVSFEYAGHSGGGGIGTYVRNAAQMFRMAGHQVHVFTSGPTAQTEPIDANLVITMIPSLRGEFPQSVLGPFRTEHERESFDVVEGPEYGSDARVIAEAFPQLPLVVRLHGPSFSIANSNAHYVGWWPRLRFALGAIRRGCWPRDPWRYDAARDPERKHVFEADEVVANSSATADYCKRTWQLPPSRLSVVPYPFAVPDALGRLEPKPNARVVLFLGKLEVRKGVLELARAIPLVLKQHPDVKFRLVGRILLHPGDGRSLSEHIDELVGAGAQNVEMVGSVPYKAIANEFADVSICVFPSDWEASGFVCFEGMASARAVVGSRAGGMAEIIEHDLNGKLVANRDPVAIATALNQLLDSPEMCERLGREGRAMVTERFAPHAILPLQLAAYGRAIENARARNSRVRYG